MNCLRYILFAALALAAPAAQVFIVGWPPKIDHYSIVGTSVNLVWNPPYPNLGFDGYRLYYGGASQTYTNTIDTGTNRTCTVSNLLLGATYYFAVTAYGIDDLVQLHTNAFTGEAEYWETNGTSVEYGFSTEISITITP